jgi:hypothetical protein
MRDYKFNTEDIRAALLPGEARDMELYRQGLIDGVCMYAWWKDGTQYVGTTSKTLKTAIEEIRRERP